MLKKYIVGISLLVVCMFALSVASTPVMTNSADADVILLNEPEVDPLGTRAIAWDAQITFDDGAKGDDKASDFVIMGEAPDANDGPPADSYDAPKSPTPPSPYVYAFFDDGLSSPYNKLTSDYRYYCDGDDTQWNLTLQWDLSSYPETINFTWSSSDFTPSPYGSVYLRDSGGVILADMLAVEIYTFSVTTGGSQQFFITGENATCPLPGENCFNPYQLFDIPVDLDFTHSADTTGLVDNYGIAGEDAVYLFDVTEESMIDVILENVPAGAFVGIYDDCPDVGNLLISASASKATALIDDYVIAPGQYYLMVDGGSFTYDLIIEYVNDVGVTNINTFDDGDELNANVSYPVEVEVCNYGNDEASIPVHVVINGTGTGNGGGGGPTPIDYTQDFEGTFPPTDWTVINNGGDCIWERNDVYGTPNNAGTGYCAAADSDDCGYGTTMDTALISPSFDLTGGYVTANLEFGYDFNYYSYGGAEYLAVDYSIDSGSTWTNIITWDDDDYQGIFSQDVSSLIGNSDVMFRWVYYAPGWEMYATIDDVHFTASSSLKTVVYDETVTVSLDSGECADVVLPDWYATPGNYTIDACTELPTDDNNVNNCTSVDVVVLPGVHDVGATEVTSPGDHIYVGDPYTVEATICNFGDFDEPDIPVHVDIYYDPWIAPECPGGAPGPGGAYFEGFEDDDGGYTHAVGPGPGYNDNWEWGAPTSGPGSAYNGTNVWATNLNGDFDNYHDGVLDSVEISVPNDSPVFSFWHWHEGFYDWDCGNCKISTDGGSTWSILVPIGGYPQTAASSNQGIPGEPAFDDTAGWEQVTFDMAAYAGETVKIRWHFGSSSVVTYPGWYIDDVSMTGAKSMPPAEARDGTKDWTLVFTADASIALLEGECGTVSFSPDFVPNGPGEYMINVTTQLANDYFTYNDSTSGMTEAFIPNVLNVDTGLWYTTIQQAVDAANPGDVLQAVSNPVPDGYYNEYVEVDEEVTIMPYNDEMPVLDASCGGIGFNVLANNVVIYGFKIIDGTAAVSVNGVIGVTVRECYIENNTEGVQLIGASEYSVVNNTFCYNDIGVANYEGTYKGTKGDSSSSRDVLLYESFEDPWVSSPSGGLAPPGWDYDQTTTEINPYGYTCYFSQDYYSTSPPSDGTYCALSWWGYQGHDEYLMTPSIDLGGYANTELSFMTYVYGEYSTYPEDCEILVSTDGGSTWDFIADLNDMYTYPDGQEWDYPEVFDLSAYDGQTIIIAFHHWSLDGGNTPWMIDEVEVTADISGPTYTLTVDTVGNGFVVKDPDKVEYPAGSTVELTAVSDPGWMFDHWEDDLTGSANPETIVMDENKLVTAVFDIDVSGMGGIHYNWFGCECETPAIAIQNFNEFGAIPDARWNWYNAPDGPSGDTIDAITGRPADGFGFSVLGNVSFDPWWGVDALADVSTMNVLVGDPIIFDGSDSFGVGFDEDDLTLTYLWDFDNGQYSMEEQTSYSYEEAGVYHGYLRVAANDLDLWGNTMYDWDYFTIVVSEPGQPLGANADGNDLGEYEGTIEEPVTFYGTASGGVPDYTFEWLINGETLTGQTVEYTFTEAGTYTVELTVTDSESNTALDTATVNIADVDELVAKAGGPYDTTATEPVQLKGSATGGKSPYTYTWEFGDGTSPVTAQNPLHVYEESGTYTVTLTVTDSIGNSDESTAKVTVAEDHDEPEIINVKGGLSVKATVVANDLPVDWTITIDGKYVFGRSTATGTVAPFAQETIRAPFVFGLGNVDITITANDVVSEHTAFMVGPFVLSLN